MFSNNISAWRRFYLKAVQDTTPAEKTPHTQNLNKITNMAKEQPDKFFYIDLPVGATIPTDGGMIEAYEDNDSTCQNCAFKNCNFYIGLQHPCNLFYCTGRRRGDKKEVAFRFIKK